MTETIRVTHKWIQSYAADHDCSALEVAAAIVILHEMAAGEHPFDEEMWASSSAKLRDFGIDPDTLDLVHVE